MINPLAPWPTVSFVALDLETTGKYPLEAEICEIAALRYENGAVVEEFQSLVKPSKPMNEEVIAIHHITNEMVASAPPASDVVPRFHRFLGRSVGIAHHAPFDMGFLAWEFEKANLPLPTEGSLCTALISRKALPASPNHRLQTLIHHLGLTAGQAHRALDDARGCLEVAVRCFQRIGEKASLADLYQFQGAQLLWPNFSIHQLCEKEAMLHLVSAIRQNRHVEIAYQGGSRPGQPRELVPVGIVRNPNGDFLVAHEPAEIQTKRFFLSQIITAKILA